MKPFGCKYTRNRSVSQIFFEIFFLKGQKSAGNAVIIEDKIDLQFATKEFILMKYNDFELADTLVAFGAPPIYESASDL